MNQNLLKNLQKLKNLRLATNFKKVYQTQILINIICLMMNYLLITMRILISILIVSHDYPNLIIARLIMYKRKFKYQQILFKKLKMNNKVMKHLQNKFKKFNKNLKMEK